MKESVKREARRILDKYSSTISIDYLKNETYACGTWDYWWKRTVREVHLSEDFIKEFQDKVNWDNISRYQKLSEKFILDFEEILNIGYLIKSNKINKNKYKEYKEQFRIHNRFDILDL